MPTLNLPVAGGKLAPYATKPPRNFPAAKPPFNRIAYAAAHVVADPLADGDPWLDAAIDWERTIAFRRHLWSLGLGVAEAMDTAQRGMGMDWPTSLELIRRSLDAAQGFSRRADRLRRRHRPPRAGRERDHRRRHPRLRGAMRGGREARRAHRADGEPRAGEGGALARRLRQGLRPHPRPGEGAGDHPLARRDVRSGARRLLGPQGPHAGDGRRRRRDRRQRRQGRRREDLAARQGQGDRHAPPPAAGRAHVYRRRLQLRRADRRRRARLFRRAARHLRRDRAGGRGGARRLHAAATRNRSTTSWRRRCRCRATSSRRRPASTRPAWCSWPISTACRTISPWSAARRARARRLHLAELFRLADAAGLLPIPTGRPRACAR